MTISGLRGKLRLAACLLAACGLAFAQAGSDSSKGSIAVEVHDTSGAVIPSASVTLTGPEGDKKASADARGQVVFFGLVPGDYSVTVEVKGFRQYQAQAIHVIANQRSALTATLEPGTLTETVQVLETATAVDTSSTTIGVTMTDAQYQNMPVQRNVASLFSMAPGAAPGLGTDNLQSPKQSFNPSIGGASGLENQYIIDGINTTDQGYGAFGVWSNTYGSMGSGVNFDFVKEIQVKTGGFEAQYGQALGGVLNVVTDSGTNKLHGSIYAYSAPAWAEGEYAQPNAAPRVSQPTTELLGRHSFDAGFNLGGPFVKDKFFWYGGFNPSFNSLSRQAPVNFGARALGPQMWDSHNYNWVGKLDYNITDNHRLEATGFGDPSRDPSGVHRSLLRDDLQSASSMLYGTRNWAVKYSGVLTTTTLISLSFGWNHSYFEETPSNNLYSIRDYSKPKPNAAYTLEGGIGFYENSNSDNRQYNAMVTKNANVLGSHQIDLGYSFNDVNYDAFHVYSGANFPLPAQAGIDPADVGKTQYGGLFYLYPSRTIGGVAYQNVYRGIRGNFSNPNIGTGAHYEDAFVQDAWQVNRYVTLKLGVRWEQQQIHGLTTRYVFANNWAPRLGFIIDPTGSRKTKIFANWGRFFEKVPQDIAVRAMTTESSYLNVYSLGVPPTASNLIPGAFASPSGVDPTIIYGGTKSQYQEEIVAGVERELGREIVLRASFTHRNLNRIIEDMSGITVEQALAGSGQQYVISNPSVNLDIFHNAITCTSGPNCDPNSGYTLDSGSLGSDGLVDGFPDPRRVYNAFELSAEKRFGHNWSLLANYRVAKLFGNYEGLFRNDNGQSDPNITSLFDFANSPALADQFRVGVLPTDRRDILNLFGNYVFAGKVNVGMGFQSLSGTPLTKLLAHPAYGNAGELPDGPRGAYGRSPWQNYVDLHVDYRLPLHSERLRLKLSADMFNLFNRTTPVLIDQNFQLDGGVPNSDFLKPTYDHRPIYARFAARLEF
ncbi:MAG TPA: TonB-dependent receptor [Bryobacteraceae bacterium]|nr:TonB-dependent receptor [Bryobacteraceae bacterium]